MTLGIVGVPLHELAHLFTAVLFNHKIVGFALFKPSIDGSLGYVSHEYKLTWFAPFANLVIGLAPLAAGIGGFMAVTGWFRPDLLGVISSLQYSFTSLTDLNEAILTLTSKMLTAGGFWNSAVWLLISFSILLFCVPSKADFYGCRPGVVSLICMGLIGLWLFPATFILGVDYLAPYMMLIGAMLWSVLVLQSVLFVLFIGIRFFVRQKIKAVTG